METLLYIKSLNQKPNKKSFLKGPEKYDEDVRIASILMAEPQYSKAFSERFGDNKRRKEIDNYKYENFKVNSILKQLAAKRADIVDKIPFDSFDDNLALKLIDQYLMYLYDLIQNNTLVIRNYVEDTIEPINENINEFHEEFLGEMEVLNKKIDMLLPKVKKRRQVQPLRDPIDFNLFPIFLVNAKNSCQRKKDLRRAQLRIIYTILYHCILHINEIRHLTQQDLIKAMDAVQFYLIHHKTKQAHIHVLSKKGIQDLKEIYKKFDIPFNIKSHSFRVNMITNLLKVTSVQNTADIMGHADIISTMIYNRYVLSKTEIQNLLDQINKNK